MRAVTMTGMFGRHRATIRLGLRRARSMRARPTLPPLVSASMTSVAPVRAGLAARPAPTSARLHGATSSAACLPRPRLRRPQAACAAPAASRAASFGLAACLSRRSTPRSTPCPATHCAPGSSGLAPALPRAVGHAARSSCLARFPGMNSNALRPPAVAARIVPGHVGGRPHQGRWQPRRPRHPRGAHQPLPHARTPGWPVRTAHRRRLHAPAGHRARAPAPDPHPQPGLRAGTPPKACQATAHARLFRDAHSPWQRGSNGNVNGILRELVPEGMTSRPSPTTGSAALRAPRTAPLARSSASHPQPGSSPSPNSITSPALHFKLGSAHPDRGSSPAHPYPVQPPAQPSFSVVMRLKSGASARWASRSATK